MKNWEKYKPLKGTYVWTDYVGETYKSEKRTLRKIPMVQIAVSFKDSRLLGTRSDADYWVMLVYTFDRKSINKLQSKKLIPKPFKHMKAMGIQTGFEPEYSTIFPGSVSNHMEMEIGDDGEYSQEKWIPNGPKALLNGASDNALSSCMGCHAADFGPTSKAIVKHLKPDPKRGDFTWMFSFYKAKDFQFIKDIVRRDYGPSFDFNLQLESSSKRVKSYLCQLDADAYEDCDDYLE